MAVQSDGKSSNLCASMCNYGESLAIWDSPAR